MAESQQEQSNQESIQEVTDFNKRFEAYNKTTVRGYQMISLANLVYDTNYRYTEEDGYKPVTIIVDGLSSQDATNEDLVTYIQNNYDGMNSNEKNALKQLYFECTDISYDSQNSRVLSMHFKRVNKVN